ncbi:unnamed protein product [Mucor hiemalis]
MGIPKHDKHKEEELVKKTTQEQSARQAQYNRDTDMWKATRMLSSGVAQRIEVDTDFDEENESWYIWVSSVGATMTHIGEIHLYPIK